MARAILANINWDFEEGCRVFADFHDAFFFLDSKYYEVANRLTRLRYVCVFPSPEKDFNYRFVGYVVLVGFALKALTFFGAVWKTFRHLKEEEEVSSSTEETATQKESGHDCKICYDTRKDPSAAQCGHVFCWGCLIKYSQMKGECPICRAKVHPKDIVILFNTQ